MPKGIKHKKGIKKSAIKRIIIRPHFDKLHINLSFNDFIKAGVTPIMMNLVNPGTSTTKRFTHKKTMPKNIARTLGNVVPVKAYVRPQGMKSLVISNIYFHAGAEAFDAVFPWFMTHYPDWVSEEKPIKIRSMIVRNNEHGINCLWVRRGLKDSGDYYKTLTFEAIDNRSVDTIRNTTIKKYAAGLSHKVCNMVERQVKNLFCEYDPRVRVK